MTRRYDILKGDKTTAGGTVEGGDDNDKVGHREQAYEDDPVWVSVLRDDGADRVCRVTSADEGTRGREGALSDDLCVCQCNPSPSLIPSQYTSHMDA